MQLKDFIKGSLVEISQAIIEANEALKSTDAKVCPSNVTIFTNPGNQHYGIVDSKSNARVVEVVEFDVAVHVAEGQEAKGGIGIMVGAFGIGGSDTQNSSSKSESRLKFKIPVHFPKTRVAS